MASRVYVSVSSSFFRSPTNYGAPNQRGNASTETFKRQRCILARKDIESYTCTSSRLWDSRIPCAHLNCAFFLFCVLLLHLYSNKEACACTLFFCQFFKLRLCFIGIFDSLNVFFFQSEDLRFHVSAVSSTSVA